MKRAETQTRSDKRRFQRWDARGLTALVRHADRSFTCEVVNISLAGLLLKTQRQLPAGAELEVALGAPGQPKAVELEASVVPTTGERPGVALVVRDPTREQRARFAMLLSLLSSSEPVMAGNEAARWMAVPSRSGGASKPSEAPPARLDPELSPHQQAPRSGPPPALEAKGAATLGGPASAGPVGPGPAIQTFPWGDYERLKLQLRGVLNELGVARDALRRRDQELAKVNDELALARNLLQQLARPR